MTGNGSLSRSEARFVHVVIEESIANVKGGERVSLVRLGERNGGKVQFLRSVAKGIMYAEVNIARMCKRLRNVLVVMVMMEAVEGRRSQNVIVVHAEWRRAVHHMMVMGVGSLVHVRLVSRHSRLFEAPNGIFCVHQ